MSKTSPADTVTNTGSVWLPGAITAVLLLGTGKLVTIAYRQFWWLHDNDELLSFLSQAAWLRLVSDFSPQPGSWGFRLITTG